ncbi:hypothetical protein BDA96_01G070900 [Sorghum bicolor]|uniref:Uncharacterized protein n=2 Tax=Sorghum bicolor TaxID=4558 RepID=A0A921RWB6_SORBI|nr:hypothetical protein BDA96_01G070900 [Sorghum bicolor]KXG37431.1 hypothetical protein SORBI_3001G068400 [Sorghum bicolor]
MEAEAVLARCANGRPDLDYRWVQHGPGHSHPILKQDCCDLHAALDTKSLPTATPQLACNSLLHQDIAVISTLF